MNSLDMLALYIYNYVSAQPPWSLWVFGEGGAQVTMKDVITRMRYVEKQCEVVRSQAKYYQQHGENTPLCR